MKYLIPILMLVAIATSSQAGWWDNQPSQHEQQLEQQVQQEQHTNNGLGIAVVVLGIGCIACTIVGTMIGSRTRRKANENKPIQQDVPLD